MRPKLGRLRIPLLVAGFVVLLVIFVLAVSRILAPQIDSEFGGATVHLSADRALIVLPGECALLKWDVEGIQSIYLNGKGKIGRGEQSYCPTGLSISPQFKITAADGSYQTFTLGVFSIDLAFIALYLIFVLMILAVFYLVTVRLDQPPSPKSFAILCSLFAVVALMMAFSGHMAFINLSLDFLKKVFRDPRWQLSGVVLALVIYAPLVFQCVRKGLDRDKRHDLIVIVGFLVLVFLLFLPAGFDSIGHWEAWPFRAYLEGRPSKTGIELVSRFWVLVPHALAMHINRGSFAGYHILNLLMFWGQLIFLYGIFRKLKVAPLFAFLTVILFLVYPVNSRLMSLRSFGMTFSKLSLLAAVYLALEIRNNPSRLNLLGVFLALLLNVGSNEIAYAVIAVIPLLWWWRNPRLTWTKVNLSVIWYLAPMLKVVYLLLLELSDRQYYGSFMLNNTTRSAGFPFDSISYYLEIVGNLFRRTFVLGWQEAVSALSQNSWLVPITAMLVLTGAITAILVYDTDKLVYPSRRQLAVAFISGLLFILPAIGVLMWLEKYNRDPWRMYVYVPVGAAIAVSSLILLLALSFQSVRIRRVVVVGLHLLIMLPALARLFHQQAHYVDNANAKAKILLQIVEQAPAFEPDAQLILMTEMPGSELRRKGVGELRTNMLDGAAFILYGEVRPLAAYLCVLGRPCSKDDIDIRRGHLEDTTDFSDIVLFRLHDDLSVELLRELPSELGGSDIDTYNPDRLIDTSAPIPPRALTMLATARRAFANP